MEVVPPTATPLTFPTPAPCHCIYTHLLWDHYLRRFDYATTHHLHPTWHLPATAPTVLHAPQQTCHACLKNAEWTSGDVMMELPHPAALSLL